MKRGSLIGFVVIGLVVAAVLAGIVSGFASSSPDGLERVAEDQGFIDQAEDHDLAGSPVADYGVRGVDDARLSTGLAGLLGVTVTFACRLRAVLPGPPAGRHVALRHGLAAGVGQDRRRLPVRVGGGGDATRSVLGLRPVRRHVAHTRGDRSRPASM